jgi:hypothetical protein
VSSFQKSELQRVTEFDGSINIGVPVGSSVNEMAEQQKMKTLGVDAALSNYLGRVSGV